MHLVAIVHFYVPTHMAGSETMLHAMLRAAHADGHTVTVLTTEETDSPAEYELDGIRVIRTDPSGVGAYLSGLRPDVLISHHQNVMITQWHRLRLRLPAVHIVHNTFPDTVRFTHLMEPDLVVFNTQWVRAHFAALGVPPRQSLVLHPPVYGAQHKAKPGTKVTLVNLNADKGAHIFYALARQMPDIEFLGVVGGHGQQIIDDSLPNVEIMPHTSDPRTIWRKTRILLMPSVYESYGMVSIEAAHSGIPTIAHPTPGLREALGDSGIFADRLFLSGWATELERLQDSAQWRTASRAAKERASQLDPNVEMTAWLDGLSALG